jgi:hypothetical protein
MKKGSILIFLLFLTILSVRAQSGNKTTVSFGTELGIPFNTGTHDYLKTRDFYQDGISGILKLEVPITSSLHFIASGGYSYFHTNVHLFYIDMMAYYPGYTSNSNPPSPPSYKFIPLKGGLQYYYSKYMYIGGEMGASISVNAVSKTSFIYSGGLGGVIPFNPKSGLDISVRYERGYEIASYPYAMSMIGVRLAYKHSF